MRPTIRIGLAAIVLSLAALFWFDPARHAFYPQCPFKRMTGWDCPGCGGLRASHALLHGHLSDAFALNPLIFVIAPLLTFFCIVFWWERRSSHRLLPRWLRVNWPWLLLAVVTLFGAARNLPWSTWFSAN